MTARGAIPDLRTVWQLARVPLLSMFNINDIRHGKTSGDRAKAVAMLVLLGFAAVEFSFFVGLLTFGMMREGVTSGQSIALFTLLAAGGSIGALMASVYTVTGGLFRYKDYDQTAVLPVRTSELVLSRVVLTLIYDAAFALVFLFPAALVFQFMASPAWWFWPVFIIVAPTVLLIPYSAGVGIGYLSIVLTKVTRFGAAGSAVLSGAGLLALMWTINSAASDGFSLDIISVVAADLARVYPPALWAGRALATGSLLDLALFIGASWSVFYLTIMGVARVFSATNSTSTPKAKPSQRQAALRIQRQSQFGALLDKEWRRLTSSSLYMLNTMFGLGVVIAGAVSILFVSPEEIAEILQVPQIAELLGTIVPLVLSIAIGTVGISASSISLEGTNFWIVRSTPASAINVLHAKAALNVIVVVPPLVLAALCLGYALNLSAGGVALVVVTPTLMAIVISLSGLLLNLFFPKLDWQTEVVVIKQSMPVLLTLIVGAGLGIAPLFLLGRVPLTPLELTLATTATYAAVAVALYALLRTWGVRRYGEL